MRRKNPDVKKKIIWGLIIVFAIIVIGLLLPAPDTGVNVKPQCVENLREIQIAKWNWSQAKDKGPDDIPTWDDLKPYFSRADLGFKDGVPICPKSGIYTIGRMRDNPKCSIGGPRHSLSGPPFYPH
jgi:hypothetical protein